MLSLCALSQKQHVVLDGREEKHIMQFAELSYLPVNDFLPTIEEAVTAYNKGKFIINNAPILNFGIARYDYWISFTVTNASIAKLHLYACFDNPRLNGISIYYLIDGKIVPSHATGDLLPFATRVTNLNTFVSPLTINPGATIQVFALIQHKGSSLQLPVSLLTANALHIYEQKTYLIMGLRIGIFALAFFFGLFLFFSTGNRNFIFYSAYIFISAAWLWSTEGFGFQLMWPHFPGLNNRLEASLGVLYSGVFILNALQFTKQYDNNRTRLKRTLVFYMYFFLFWGLMPLLPFISLSANHLATFFLFAFFLFNISGVILMIVYLLRLFLKGHTIILYYFFAVVVTLIFSVLTVSYSFGWINLPFSASTLVSTGTIIDVILMTLGIVRQFNNYKLEKENMLMEYLKQQKSINQKILQTQEEERIRISKELHDDIGAGLTQITLMSEAAKNKYNAFEELSEIAKTGHKLVNNMSEIIWSMHPENKTVEQFFIHIREQLNELLEYTSIEYSINLPESADNILLKDEYKRDILLITKEIVHNAIKYSEATYIAINAKTTSTTLTFSITDNGIGFDMNHIRPGNGLKNMQQRVKGIQGSIKIETAPGNGTTFLYTIPLK
ncbi:MAG: hypothetical protein J0I09_06205 [Sphingobacteriia bacterium]|nr:hypothetical protein [Sphingobacteriia bacterium]